MRRLEYSLAQQSLTELAIRHSGGIGRRIDEVSLAPVDDGPSLYKSPDVVSAAGLVKISRWLVDHSSALYDSVPTADGANCQLQTMRCGYRQLNVNVPRGGFSADGP
jgi:hypothetical protein